MHDLHVADKIQKLVLENAVSNKLSTVKKVEINLGYIEEHGSDISPENLEFNLKMLLKNTVADGAEIVINKVSSDSWELVSISGD